MKILALIPARGGSKRIPGKNIKLLGQIPLIAWTITAARDSNVFVSINVSTDDESTADIARKYGANVLQLRPAHLSTDTAGSVDVALHELNLYENEHGPVDGLMLLQPTSPFRTKETIVKAMRLYAEGAGQKSVVTMSPASCHPAWCFHATSEGMAPFLSWEGVNQRSQDLPPAWTLNGAIYLISPERLRQEKSFLARDTAVLLMTDEKETIDIDTNEDWMRAEWAMGTVPHLDV